MYTLSFLITTLLFSASAHSSGPSRGGAIVERVRYDTFYAFKYSPRSGTAAARREDDVSPAEKQRRLAILLDMQRRLSHEVNQAYVGRRLEVLVEGVTAANDQSGRKLKFLRRVPVDPMTRSTEWGLRSYQDEPDAIRWGGENVFDVYTTFDGTALDGTNYRDW